jgi:hypothetical protein
VSSLDDLAQPAVQKLLRADEDQLYEQLGLRLKALTIDPATAGSFDPAVAYDAAQMGVKEDILALGKRIFERWNREAYLLLCGTGADEKQDRARVLQSFGLGEVAVAATLAGLLVTYLGLAPALAGVIAAIVCKRFFRPAYEEFCGAWAKAVAT